jgi:hypothetical protein
MTNTQIIQQFIDANQPDQMMDWIATHDLLTQVDLLEEFSNIAQTMAFTTDNDEAIAITQEFVQNTEAYKEAILDEKMGKLKLDMATDDLEKIDKEIAETTKGIKDYIRECITTNAENAIPMKELANKIMQMEKDQGTYDENDWKEIF